jgi:hypothetical protein
VLLDASMASFDHTRVDDGRIEEEGAAAVVALSLGAVLRTNNQIN